MLTAYAKPTTSLQPGIRWFDSFDCDAEAVSTAFWFSKGTEIKNGNFWGDTIKKLRAQPSLRLAMAIDNLPLPSAFGEASAAQSDIIAGKKSRNIACDNDVSFLYWLAAIRSLMIPYADRLKEPGYNVLEAMPGQMLRAIALPWQELGYLRLPYINKTSARWLIEQYGAPKRHSTLFELRHDLWIKYEDVLIARRSAAADALIAALRNDI